MDFRAKAKRNGDITEELAKKFLRQFFSKIIQNFSVFYDFLVNESTPIEVKSCQAHIEDYSLPTRVRKGRFCFDEEQHKYLKKNGGYYLFIVHNCNWKRVMLTKAEDILNEEFRRQVIWTVIMGIKDYGGSNVGE